MLIRGTPFSAAGVKGRFLCSESVLVACAVVVRSKRNTDKGRVLGNEIAEPRTSTSASMSFRISRISRLWRSYKYRDAFTSPGGANALRIGPQPFSSGLLHNCVRGRPGLKSSPRPYVACHTCFRSLSHWSTLTGSQPPTESERPIFERHVLPGLIAAQATTLPPTAFPFTTVKRILVPLQRTSLPFHMTFLPKEGFLGLKHRLWCFLAPECLSGSEEDPASNQCQLMLFPPLEMKYRYASGLLAYPLGFW